jgi:hypothetical protein
MCNRDDREQEPYAAEDWCAGSLPPQLSRSSRKRSKSDATAILVEPQSDRFMVAFYPKSQTHKQRLKCTLSRRGIQPRVERVCFIICSGRNCVCVCEKTTTFLRHATLDGRAHMEMFDRRPGADCPLQLDAYEQ